MKTLWNYSNYGNDLKLSRRDADFINGSGNVEPQVREVMNKPYVKKQLALLNPDTLAKELSEFGAWDEDQLANHDDNLMRWVWTSGTSISEENN